MSACVTTDNRRVLDAVKAQWGVTVERDGPDWWLASTPEISEVIGYGATRQAAECDLCDALRQIWKEIQEDGPYSDEWIEVRKKLALMFEGT